MKKTLILITAILFVMACTDKTKKEDKKVEENIKKIDSIEASVEKDIENLEKTTKDIEEDFKKLDNI